MHVAYYQLLFSNLLLRVGWIPLCQRPMYARLYMARRCALQQTTLAYYSRYNGIAWQNTVRVANVDIDINITDAPWHV